MRPFLRLLGSVILVFVLGAPAHLDAQPGNRAARHFQGDIARMLAREKTNPPPQAGILFIGSSIFRFWTELNQQMAPLPVFNHAFGGSLTQDILDWTDELVLPYKPRIIAYYCGSNDVSTGESADAILDRTKQFLKIINEKLPNTYVYYTAIQKAPEKQDRWDVVDAVNREMQRYSKQAKNVGFVDLNPVLFDRQGRVREELFLPDGLHFRPDSSAYLEFSQIMKPILAKAWESGVGLSGDLPATSPSTRRAGPPGP